MEKSSWAHWWSPGLRRLIQSTGFFLTDSTRKPREEPAAVSQPPPLHGSALPSLRPLLRGKNRSTDRSVRLLHASLVDLRQVRRVLPPPLGVCASVCDIKGRAFLTGCARSRATATRVFFFFLNQFSVTLDEVLLI